MLLDSADRNEAIERYIEEKLRGIFYGNPVDVFKANKLGFNIHEELCGMCADEIALFTEMVARRNVIVHNRGNVDRKYEEESGNPSLRRGAKIVVDEPYLFQAFKVLNELGKHFVSLVALRTTGAPLPKSRVGEVRGKNVVRQQKKGGQ